MKHFNTKDAKASFLTDFFDQDPFERALLDAVALAASAEVKDKTERIRQLQLVAKDSKIATEAIDAKRTTKKLKQSLPCLLTNVICQGGKKRENIKTFQPCMGFDVDDLPEAEVVSLMERFKQDPHVVFAEPSCSRAGVHFTLAYDQSEWLNERWDRKDLQPYYFVWKQVKQYAEQTFQVRVDEKCKNPEHIFALNYDDLLVFNNEVEPLHIDITAFQQPAAKPLITAPGTHRASLAEVLPRIEQYLSQQGKLFTPGNRNNYVHLLSSACNHFGVTESEVEGYCVQTFEQPDFPEQEIRTTVRSAYRQTGEYGTWSVTAPVTTLVTALVTTPQPVTGPAQPTPAQSPECDEALLQLAETMRVTAHDDIPADVNTVSIGGVDTFAYEGMHLVKAKAKQGKTSMLALLMAVYLRPDGCWGPLRRLTPERQRVLYIDTEQKRYDSQLFIRNVQQLAGLQEEDLGDDFQFYNMRGEVDTEQKKRVIELLIERVRPQVLAIDGIVDLLKDFNEVADSQELTLWLMGLADKYKVVLFCVLHTNKSADDHNMRGHLGTMVEQKCDVTLECSKEAEMNFVTVKCAVSRHKPFPEWHFAWDDQGHLVSAEEMHRQKAEQQAEEAKAKRERKKQETFDQRKQILLQVMRERTALTRADLTAALITRLDRGHSTVSPLITQWLNEGVIHEGEDGLIRI